MYFRYLITLCCLLLSACSSLSPNINLEHPDWAVSGKIGIRDMQGKNSSNLFNWRQKNDLYVIYLSNSLGQTQLTLSGDQHRAIAQQADGKTFTAASAEELLMHLTGWQLPLKTAQQWLQGQLTGSETDIVSTNNTVSSFAYQDWLVQLSQYQMQNEHNLPRRLQLKNAQLAITIIIKDYEAL